MRIKDFRMFKRWNDADISRVERSRTIMGSILSRVRDDFTSYLRWKFVRAVYEVFEPAVKPYFLLTS